jgi:hypothetical protein
MRSCSGLHIQGHMILTMFIILKRCKVGTTASLDCISTVPIHIKHNYNKVIVIVNYNYYKQMLAVSTPLAGCNKLINLAS